MEATTEFDYAYNMKKTIHGQTSHMSSIVIQRPNGTPEFQYQNTENNDG